MIELNSSMRLDEAETVAMSEPASIFILASYADSVQQFRGELIEGLLRRNIDVHLAVPLWEASLQAREYFAELNIVVHDAPVRRSGMSVFEDIRYCYRIFRLLSRIRPKYFLAYTIKPVVYGSLAAWLARVPLRYSLITGLGYAFTGADRRALRIFVEFLYRIALSKSTKTFFQNPDDENLFRTRKLLKPEQKSKVLNGSGVDLSHYRLSPHPASLSFLMIARLLGNKGVREYVAAAEEVREDFPQVCFNLVGWLDNGPDSISENELQEWIDRKAIRFWGRLEDVRPAIHASSVYVLPSYREGTPRTVLEAMAMGRAIITTDAPGCRETVIPEENGFLVPVKSSHALKLAMLRFLHFPVLVETMGLRSRQIAEERFDVQRVNATMLQEMGIP